MIKLAHLSDIHLTPLPPVSPLQLANKRITGYLNWRFRRKHALGGTTLDALTAHLLASHPDCIAVAGDLVNLALPDEFDNAARWLETLGPPQSVCVVPGNHDAYVPGALEAAKRSWGDYMRGETLDNAQFPYARRLGDVAIVGCSSAIATPPFIAAGRFDEAQAGRLARILKHLDDAGYFRVVMIHHPPVSDDVELHKRLIGADLFRRAIAKEGAELVLHGHTHRATIHSIAGPNGDVPVVGVAAAGAGPASRSDPARYNLFDIEKSGSKWSCIMREWGFQRIGEEIVLRLEMRIH
jgi:3',5'-cyclic AMP phosphodiesterase CpdA